MTTRRLLLAGLPLLSLGLALLITAILILLLQGDPVKVLETTWSGAFKDSQSTAAVFNFWIPLTLVGAGLIISFTAGQWNIGVEGQMMMGALGASWGAQFLPLPAELRIPACLVMAMIGGALWGWLVAILKTRAGVNEIFGGVALNALADTMAIYLISGPWQPPEGGSAQSTPLFSLEAKLPVISPELPISWVTLVLAVSSVLFVTFLLQQTRVGLMLKAAGKNARSALLLGVPTEGMTWLAFMLCGALAGAAGAHRVLHTYHSLRPLVSGGIGFLGLLVVLLVAYRPLIMPFIALALAAVIAGSASVKIKLDLDQSLTGVLQGLVVLLILLFNGVRVRLEASQDPAP